MPPLLRLCFGLSTSLLFATVLVAEEPTAYRVTGLFSRDRAQDLRETIEKLPEIRLVSVDFATAEARFAFDPGKAFPGAKPEQIVERLDNAVKQASRHTFGIRPLSTIPRDKLQFVEIPVAGLDCKGCCLAAYEAIYKLDGVEQATASFRDGLVTAWIDPGKTDRSALEEALKKKQVHLRAR